MLPAPMTQMRTLRFSIMKSSGKQASEISDILAKVGENVVSHALWRSARVAVFGRQAEHASKAALVDFRNQSAPRVGGMRCRRPMRPVLGLGFLRPVHPFAKRRLEIDQ